MPVTDSHYEGFLSRLGTKQVTKNKDGDIPADTDRHRFLLTRIAYQRKGIVGVSNTEEFLNDMLGGDYKSVTRNKTGEISYISRRPSVPATILRGMLLNRGVSMTQIMSGNIDPQIKAKVSSDFREASTDPVKMGKLFAEALNGVSSFDINREFRDALGEPGMTPAEIRTEMGTDTGRILTAVYLAGFKNMAQEIKQFGDHVFELAANGAVYSKNEDTENLGLMGDAFMSSIEDDGLGKFWRVTHLADAIGNTAAGPELLCGYYTSGAYNPALGDFSEIKGFPDRSQPVQAAEKAVAGAMAAQDLGCLLSKAGKAGELGIPGKEYYRTRLQELKGKFAGVEDANRLLADPVSSLGLMNTMLNPGNRMDIEIALARETFDLFPTAIVNADEKGLSIAFKSFVSGIPDDRLKAELGKGFVSRTHPFNLAGLTAEQRQDYAAKRESWAKNLRELNGRLSEQLASCTDEERKKALKDRIEHNAAKAAKLDGEVQIVRSLENIDKPAFNAADLIEDAQLRPELKERLKEIGRIRALVTEECKAIWAEKGNGESIRDFYESDARDMGQLCVIPDSITDDAARRAYVRSWVDQWKDKPEGRKKCLDAFFDIQDRLAVKSFDLSCLTAADESEVKPDGLTASEHDLIDMLYMRSSSQARATKGFEENLDYFRTRYGSDNAIAIFKAIRGRDLDGMDFYIQGVMLSNGMDADNLQEMQEGGRTMGMAASTMRNITIVSQRFQREIAPIFGKTPSDVSGQRLILSGEATAVAVGYSDGSDIGAEKSEIVRILDKYVSGAALETTELLKAQELFDSNFGMLTGANLKDYNDKRKEFGVDIFDTIFIDGKPLKEFVGNKYGDPKDMNAAQLNELGRKYYAEAALAAMSGEHRVEYAEILKDKDGKSLVNLVSVQIDLHALDSAENKAHHNLGRRAFNFGLTRLETRADRADRLWADDPDKDKRKALAAAKLYQKAESYKAAAALKTEWESSKTAVTDEGRTQKEVEAALKAAHEDTIYAAPRASLKPLTAEEYEAAMAAEFNTLSTPRQKAQMLLGLAVAKAAGGMCPAEAEAANNFMVLGLLGRHADGTIAPNTTREIFREFAKLQSEAALAMSAAYTDRLAVYGAAAGAEAKAMLDVTGSSEGYEHYILESFAPDRVLGLIEPDKLSGEAASHYAIMTAPNNVFPEGFGFAAKQVYEQQMAMEAAALTEEQKRTRQRMQEALEPAKLQAAGLTEDDLDAVVYSMNDRMADRDSVYTAYRMRTAEQFGHDANRIYDTAVMSEFLAGVAELPVLKDEYWIKTELMSISRNLVLNGQKKEITPFIREKINDMMSDASEVLAMLPPGKRAEVRAAYNGFRENFELQKRINNQPLNAAMELVSDTTPVYETDRLYYRMTAQDMADPKHKDSPEYKAMFEAVKAVHDAAADYDPKDMDSRAAMAALMEAVHESSRVYAEAEAYKKKNGEIGLSRKNSALMALYISSGGNEPDLARIKDLRIDRRGKAASDAKTLLQRLAADAAAKYGAAAQQARDTQTVAASVQRQQEAADSVYRGQMAAYRRAKRQELAAERNHIGIKDYNRNNDVYFGLDGSLFDESGLRADAALPADATQAQKDMFEKMKSLQHDRQGADGKSVMSGSEFRRGGFGGAKNLAVLNFINEMKEKGRPVSMADALDPDKYQEEKRQWGEKIISAMMSARADQPDTKDLAVILGTAIKTLNSIDVKGETLKYLGYPADLPADQAAAVMNDKGNFIKTMSIIQAQSDLALGAYQIIQNSGISNGLIYWDKIDFSKRDPHTGTLTEEALAGVMGSKPVPAELYPFIEQVVQAAGETEIAGFSYSKSSTKALAKARGVADFVSGKNRSIDNGVDQNAMQGKAAAAVAAFHELVDAVCSSDSISDPELYSRRMRAMDLKMSELGEMLTAGRETDIDQLLFAGMPDEQLKLFGDRLTDLVSRYGEVDPIGEKQLAEAAERLKKAAESQAKKASPEPPGKEGLEFLSKITGVAVAELENYETFYHALDTVYVNGLSATEYFKETSPELHIDDDYDPLAIGAQEIVGKKLKAFIDAASEDSHTAVFVAVEDENGLLKAVEADPAGLEPHKAANVADYNRIAARMYEDMNKVRLEALEGMRRQREAAAPGSAKPQMTSEEKAIQTTLETAVNVSEGKHRRVAGGLSGLMKMDQKISKDKPDYAALASARRQAQKQQSGAVKKADTHGMKQ
ncbi:MAG: hypothetical protein K5686_01730 [Lachnospiraceae bacterium]|nr:hypothetical protein [Lachnospiraceae bacterium]